MKSNPLSFVRSDGSIQPRPPGRPVVRITVPRDFKSDPESGRITAAWSGDSWRETWALVDTGADYNIIDEDFATRCNLTSIGTINLNSVTTSIRKPLFTMPVYLNDHDRFLLGGEFISSPLRGTQQKYDIILGMNFLERSILRLDAMKGTYTLEMIPDQLSP